MNDDAFVEEEYLAANPDVAAAVARSEFASGWHHYQLFGRGEMRRLSRPRRPLFFCHIPKTGGTTLRIGLERSVSPEEIVPGRELMESNGGRYLLLDQAVEALRQRQERAKLFRGHYHFSCGSLLPGALTITILRDPVARTVSHIKHNIRAGWITASEALDILDRGELPMVPDNLMTRYLGGSVHEAAAVSGFTEAQRQLVTAEIADREGRLQSALQRLPAIDMLGFTENLVAVAPQLAAAGFAPPHARLNITPDGLIELDERHLATIRRHTDLDQRLYEAAKREAAGRTASGRGERR